MIVRKLVAGALAAVLTLGLSACGPDGGTGEVSGHADRSAAQPAQKTYPVARDQRPEDKVAYLGAKAEDELNSEIEDFAVIRHSCDSKLFYEIRFKMRGGKLKIKWEEVVNGKPLPFEERAGCDGSVMIPPIY